MVSKRKKLPEFKHEYLKDLQFVLGMHFREQLVQRVCMSLQVKAWIWHIVVQK